MNNWVIGITGASGVIYGTTLCTYLLGHGWKVHLIISDAARRVMHDELDCPISLKSDEWFKQFGPYSGELEVHSNRDIGASIASGSFRTKGMVIVPCSMSTLSGIANGSSLNLIQRAADVMLKEGRPFIIVPRETPLHQVHLANMLRLAQMGVKIVPAMPAFYSRPTSLDDIVHFVVGKVLDLMDIEHHMFRRWGENT
jgi:4-hydroxy-3-polyprenylbenzoate decarboxylase